MSGCELIGHPSAEWVWHAVMCKPRQEAIAEENLLRQGYEVYLPRLVTRQRSRGAWREIVQALFPRYLFVRVRQLCQNVAPIRSTRGAIGLVRFGAEPAIVPAALIESIRARAEGTTGLHADPARQFREGEKVAVMEGPLSGMEGIFSSEDGEKRAILLLELLGKTNPVKVQRDWISRAA